MPVDITPVSCPRRREFIPPDRAEGWLLEPCGRAACRSSARRGGRQNGDLVDLPLRPLPRAPFLNRLFPLRESPAPRSSIWSPIQRGPTMPTRRARKRVLIRRLGIPLAVLTLIAVMVVAPASANLLGSNDGNLVVNTSGKSLLSIKTSGYRADGRGFAIAPSSHSPSVSISVDTRARVRALNSAQDANGRDAVPADDAEFELTQRRRVASAYPRQSASNPRAFASTRRRSPRGQRLLDQYGASRRWHGSILLAPS